MAFAAGDLSFHVRPYQLLPLLIPVAVVLVQLAYPTLLGWAVIVMPSVFFAGVGVVSVILTAPVRIQRHESAALVISSIAAAVYVLVCVALWFARPKRPDAAAVQPAPASYEQE
jgi:amino acid transporter